MDPQKVMKEFVEDLKESYQNRDQLNCEEQWPPMSREKLINLQLVETEKKEGFGAGLRERDSETKDDKVNRIRTPILCCDLFTTEAGKKRVKKVIVEGHAGIGKTTLCTMLTEGWAEGTSLTQFSFVLLLPLRDPMVTLATSLQDLLALYHPDETICECVAQQMKRTKGKGVLIIADGWDELDKENRSKQSFLYNLLFGRHLPSASVLLTSRPSASADLHDLHSVDRLVDRLVEVTGFNEGNIKQFILSEICPEKASSLLEQVENNPLINSVCSVPLNCAIICNLWQTMDQDLPSTLTELYTLIVLNVILRNFKKESISALSLENFDSIPEDLRDEFWKTCEFAYECLSRDQIVFSEGELASLFPHISISSNQFLCFGLLQSARSLLPSGQGLSFHFAHLSFQEFLAALHFVTLSTEKKLQIMETHARNDRFDNVWRFVFGLSSRHKLSSKFECVNNELIVHQFLKSLSTPFLRRQDKLLLSYCALESSDEAVCTEIARQLKGYSSHFRVQWPLDYTSLSGYNFSIAQTPHDCAAIFHVLRHSIPLCSIVNIPLRGCGLRDKQLKELTDLLSDAHGKLQVINVQLGNNELTDNGINDLFERASASFSRLHDLTLSSNKITDITPSLRRICSNTCILTKLSLSDNPLGVSSIQSLEEAVHANTLFTLEWLHLSNTLTEDADINGALLTMLLPSIAAGCPCLELLDLSENNLGVAGACALRCTFPLFSCKSKFHLDLSKTSMYSEAIAIFTEASFTCHSTHFDEFILNLSGNFIGYDGFLAVVWMLKDKNCPITELNLSRTDCCISTFQDVTLHFGPVAENSRLTRLDLTGNDLSEDNLFVLGECIRVFKLLTKLDCYDCSLASVDITSFIDYLKFSGITHGNLEEWLLWENSIDDTAVSTLADNIPVLFPSLTDLRLSGNSLTTEGEEKLEAVLKVANKKAKEKKKVEEIRSAALSEWKRTNFPPQNEELFEVFMEMWEDLLMPLCLNDIEGLPLKSPPATLSSRKNVYSVESLVEEEQLYMALKLSIADQQTQTAQMEDEQEDQPLLDVTEPVNCPRPRSIEECTPDGPGLVEDESPKTNQLFLVCAESATLNSSSDCSVASPTSPSLSDVPELSPSVLYRELRTLTKPIQFGIGLNIPQHILDIIEQDHLNDTDGQKIALFRYIAKNYKSLGITWNSIADALFDIHGNLSLSIRTKYCIAAGVEELPRDGETGDGENY